MGKGQATFINVNMILNNPIGGGLVTAEPNTLDCCYEYIALAEIGAKTNELFNDKHSVIGFFNQSFASASIVINRNGVDAPVINDDYGKLYTLGFHNTIYGEQAMGYQIDWYKVINLLGEGDYTFKIVGTLITGGDVTFSTFTFCLKKYTPFRADNTTVLNWLHNGNIGSNLNDKQRHDYGIINWFQGIRINNSYFGNDKITTQKDFVKYQNGEMVWLENSHTNQYELYIGNAPSELHRFMQTSMIQGANLTITDFSINNPNKHINRSCIHTGEYSPKWESNTMLASVTLTFDQGYQNFNSKRS
jgi:hypothetical protein